MIVILLLLHCVKQGWKGKGHLGRGYSRIGYIICGAWCTVKMWGLAKELRNQSLLLMGRLPQPVSVGQPQEIATSLQGMFRTWIKGGREAPWITCQRPSPGQCQRAYLNFALKGCTIFITPNSRQTCPWFGRRHYSLSSKAVCCTDVLEKVFWNKGTRYAEMPENCGELPLNMTNSLHSLSPSSIAPIMHRWLLQVTEKVEPSITLTLF